VSDKPLDRRSLGLALTRLANASVADLLAAAPARSPERLARRIGLTGAPGAGKSSLAGRLAQLRARGSRLGVLAIDPTSPKSGGAILGDRIRMDDLADVGDLYIRSLGSRSATDGLTDNLPELMATMDAFGFDEVVLETVGVGQAEYAARVEVDTLVLVLLPDSGDVVQAMKAGIMEMADIFVVNKADLPRANKMATEVKRIVALARYGPGAWVPPVILTSIAQPESIAGLSGEIDRHQAWLEHSAERATLLHRRAKYRLQRLLERELREAVDQLEPSFFSASLGEQYGSLLTAFFERHREGLGRRKGPD
jgi:LAO/AO transport system kinase